MKYYTSNIKTQNETVSIMMNSIMTIFNSITTRLNQSEDNKITMEETRDYYVKQKKIFDAFLLEKLKKGLLLQWPRVTYDIKTNSLTIIKEKHLPTFKNVKCEIDYENLPANNLYNDDDDDDVDEKKIDKQQVNEIETYDLNFLEKDTTKEIRDKIRIKIKEKFESSYRYDLVESKIIKLLKNYYHLFGNILYHNFDMGDKIYLAKRRDVTSLLRLTTSRTDGLLASLDDNTKEFYDVKMNNNDYLTGVFVSFWGPMARKNSRLSSTTIGMDAEANLLLGNGLYAILKKAYDHCLEFDEKYQLKVITTATTNDDDDVNATTTTKIANNKKKNIMIKRIKEATKNEEKIETEFYWDLQNVINQFHRAFKEIRSTFQLKMTNQSIPIFPDRWDYYNINNNKTKVVWYLRNVYDVGLPNWLVNLIWELDQTNQLKIKTTDRTGHSDSVQETNKRQQKNEFNDSLLHVTFVDGSNADCFDIPNEICNNTKIIAPSDKIAVFNDDDDDNFIADYTCPINTIVYQIMYNNFELLQMKFYENAKKFPNYSDVYEFVKGELSLRRLNQILQTNRFCEEIDNYNKKNQPHSILALKLNDSLPKLTLTNEKNLSSLHRPRNIIIKSVNIDYFDFAKFCKKNANSSSSSVLKKKHQDEIIKKIFIEFVNGYKSLNFSYKSNATFNDYFIKELTINGKIAQIIANKTAKYLSLKFCDSATDDDEAKPKLENCKLPSILLDNDCLNINDDIITACLVDYLINELLDYLLEYYEHEDCIITLIRDEVINIFDKKKKISLK